MADAVNHRHMRYKRFGRIRKAGALLDFLNSRFTALTGTGASATFTGAAGQNVTWTAHAKVAGDGPFLLTTTITLPAGLSLNTSYWIQSVVNANTVTLSTSRGGPAVTMTGAGSGTHTITKESTRWAIFTHIKKIGSARVRGSSDIDNL